MPTAVDTTRVSTSSTGRSASLGTRTTPCSAQDSSQARSAISCNGRTCRSTPHSSAVVIARLASVHRAVERTRSNSCALSMATAAAEPRVSTDARRGVGLSTGGAFMMSPACGCQQSVRLERLLSEAAADSWPHSGLAEFLSIADVTRRSCDLHQRGDDPVGVGVMRAPHLTHAAAAQQLDKAITPERRALHRSRAWVKCCQRRAAHAGADWWCLTAGAAVR